MIRSKIIKFLAIFITLLDLITCAVQSFAWFTTANKVSVVGMQMRIEATRLDLTYDVYKYIDELKAPVNVTNEPDALTLTEYDSVILSRNVFTPIVIKFEFNITASTPLCIDTYCTEEETDTNYLSNIVELKFAVVPNIADNASDSDIYYAVVDYFATNISAETFKVGDIKNLELNYILTNYTQYINQGKLDLYIQLDYSETLISDFTFDIENSDTTEFANDLSLIRCYVEN